MPTGLDTAVSSIGPGPKAIPTVMAASDTALSHATGLQRRDGSRPSGNSSRTKVAAGPTPSIQTNVPTHAAAVTAGPCQPSLTAWSEMVTQIPPTANARAAEQSNQPIGFSGMREATSAPVVAKTRMNSRSAQGPAVAGTGPAREQGDDHSKVHGPEPAGDPARACAGSSAGLAQPERHVGRRHGVGHDPTQVGVQCVEVDPVAKAGREEL